MLSKDALLSRTNNGLDVFRHYIPGAWRVGRNFLNPLYKDTKPSCNVYLDRRSRQYRLKDFGNDDYSGDCFAFVGRLFSLITVPFWSMSSKFTRQQLCICCAK